MLTKYQRLEIYERMLQMAIDDLRDKVSNREINIEYFGRELLLKGLCITSRDVFIEFGLEIGCGYLDIIKLKLPELWAYRTTEDYTFWWSKSIDGPYCEKRIDVLKEIIKNMKNE